MERFLQCLLIATVLAVVFSSCEQEPNQEDIGQEITSVEGNICQETHEVEGFQVVTKYDVGDYAFNQWRITDSKSINITVEVKNVPEGTTVLIEEIGMNVVLKSTNQILNDSVQDHGEDCYRGTTQDGFFVSEKYPYQNIFSIEGLSEELDKRWDLACASGSMTQCALNETNLIRHGKVYANEIQLTCNFLIKHENEEFYHKNTVCDKILVPVQND